MFRHLALCALFLVPMTTSADTDSPTTTAVEVAGIRLVSGPPGALAIEVDGVPFSHNSTFNVVERGWTSRIYGYVDDKMLEDRLKWKPQAGGGVAATIALKSREGEFTGTQRFELTTSRTLIIHTEGTLNGSRKGMIEHRIAGIFAGWIMGREYEFGHGERTGSGIVPAASKSEGLKESTFVDDFDTLTLKTRMGPLTIRARGARFSLVDYRRNRWAGPEPIFWFGLLEQRLESGQPFAYDVELQFPPAVPPIRGIDVSTAAPAKALTEALLPQGPPQHILPTPKKLEWKDGEFAWSGEFRLETPEGTDWELVRKLTGDLQRVAREDYALTGTRAELHTRELRVVLSPAEQPEKRIEYHRIAISPSGAMIEAPTTAGLAAGFKSLRQLMRGDGTRVLFRCCEIEDYASMPMRGLHFFTGRNAREIQVRMVRDIMSALKMNHLIYQCDYMKWETHPEIWHRRYGSDKADVRAVIEAAREEQIEVTPLVNTFGHAEWLLENDAHRDLADNPDKPFAYDPSNPEVYRICDEIYAEAIELFRPRFFHIGHDEITMEGFPHREANKAVGATELILRDIAHYHDYLTTRGIRTMIWGDLFLGPGEAPDAVFAPTPEEAERRRSRLARDIFICDWHYAPEPARAFRSLGVFNRAGFDCAACTWYNPPNIVGFAEAAARELESQAPGKTHGLVQTTWAGYSFDQGSMRAEAQQYAAYVLAAEAAWNGGRFDLENPPYDFRREFARLWNQRMLPRTARAGWCIDLSEVANFSVAEYSSYLALPESAKQLPSGETRLGRTAFCLPMYGGAPRQVLLAGRFNPPGLWPERVVVPMHQRAGAIAIAAAATFGGSSDPIGTTVFLLADGTRDVVQWRPGQNVFPLDDPRSTFEAEVLWENAPHGATPAALHGYVWHNPKPATQVTQIEFVSAKTGSAMIVFGVTAIAP